MLEDLNCGSSDGSFFFFFWSGLHGSIACSLLGGGVPTQKAAIMTLDFVPLLFYSYYFCTRLFSCPTKVKLLVVLRPAPLDPLAPRDTPFPVPPTFPSITSSVSDFESVNVFVPGSATAIAVSALSRAPFQSIPVCSHHRRATCAPGRLVAFLQSSRIGRVAINFATVFCLRSIYVRIRTIPASFIAPTNEG